MARRVKKGPQSEIRPRTIAALLPEHAVNKKGAKGMAARRGLICPLLKRSEMSYRKIKRAAFVGKLMICWGTQKTPGLLKFRSRPMFVRSKERCMLRAVDARV